MHEVLSHDQKMQKLQQRKEHLKKIKVQKKTQIDKSLKVAQNSTASMGKFDKAVKNETMRTIKKKSQKINLNDVKSEVNRSKDMLKLMAKK